MMLMATGLSAADTAYHELLNGYLGKPKLRLLQFSTQLKVYETASTPAMLVWVVGLTMTVPGRPETFVTEGSVDHAVTTHNPGYATQVYQNTEYAFFYCKESGDIYKWESWSEKDFDGKAWKPLLGMKDGREILVDKQGRSKIVKVAKRKDLILLPDPR
jgi:hypothetical protein